MLKGYARICGGNRITLKKCILFVLLASTLFCTAGCGVERVHSLTYSVFPYLPDTGYYREIIENRWAEIHPDIQLIRADWDCYEDSAPSGIDVIMFDAVMRDKIIDAGWIQPIAPDNVLGAEDIFSFALEGLTVDDRLYGIPVFLCGNFLIYDQDCEALARAEHITDIEDMSEILVVNSDNPENRHQYIIEEQADTLGMANPSAHDSDKDSVLLIDRLAIEDHKQDDDAQVVAAYDSGKGQGYIGFSESMRLLDDRAGKTAIKSISFSNRENVRRLYADAAAVTAEVHGERLEKCLELLNVMAEAEVLTELSGQGGAPQYLMLARRTPYQDLAGRFPKYAQLKELADNEENHIILTP